MLGSFQNAVTTDDGAWLTRDHHSPNFTYKVKDYLTGVLLYYQHLCHRGKDHLCEDKLYEGTFKLAEGYGTSLAFGRAQKEEIIHWMDKDSLCQDDRAALPRHKADTLLWTCCVPIRKF